MRLAFLLIPFVSLVPASTLAAANYDHRLVAVSEVSKTAKERLGDKGSDEQRVDDCKVPPARRTRARPTACPWDVGS